MPNHPLLPENVIPISTYQELDTFAMEFAHGHYDLLGVIGHRGLGKSKSFEHHLDGKPHAIISGASNPPFHVHQELYRHINEAIVFDDADDFWDHQKARPMLKSLCETNLDRRPRTMTYRSRELDRLGIPHTFQTISKVVILCNTWPRGLDAVADRGLMLHFEPDVHEVHRLIETSDWFTDSEILDFVAQHLSLVTEPSLRYYIQALRMKLAGRVDWQEKTLLMIQPCDKKRSHLGVVSQILADTTTSKMTKVGQFKAATGLSQATYYRWSEEFRRAQGKSRA